jgi:hypothetical protein
MVSEKIDRKRGIRNRERTWLNHGPCPCMFLKKTKWAKWRAEKIKFKFIQLNVGRLLKSADLRYQPMYPRGDKEWQKINRIYWSSGETTLALATSVATVTA